MNKTNDPTYLLIAKNCSTCNRLYSKDKNYCPACGRELDNVVDKRA